MRFYYNNVGAVAWPQPNRRHPPVPNTEGALEFSGHATRAANRSRSAGQARHVAVRVYPAGDVELESVQPVQAAQVVSPPQQRLPGEVGGDHQPGQQVVHVGGYVDPDVGDGELGSAATRATLVPVRGRQHVGWQQHGRLEPSLDEEHVFDDKVGHLDCRLV